MQQDAVTKDDILPCTLDIISTYIAHNPVPMDKLPELISTTHAAIAALLGPAPTTAVEAPQPAVSIKKSITPDYLISLVDGKQYKSLKRHLANKGYTPASYRETFGLPADYPMVAPNYAAARSALAKAAGLGRKPGATPAPAAAPSPSVDTPAAAA